MARKVALVQQTEQARLLALQQVYDAIQGAANGARLFFVAGPPGRLDGTNAEYNLALLAELRHQAVTLTALAPPGPLVRDPASEQLTNMFLSLFPGLASTPAQEDNAP